MGSGAGFFRRTQFVLKAITAILAIITCASYGVLASLVLLPFGKQALAQYLTARAYKYTCMIFLGIRCKIQHHEILQKNIDPNTGKRLPRVIISNHQSELDITMLGSIFEPYTVVTAKKELSYIPFLGWYMLLSGTFFLNRAKASQAKNTLKTASEEMNKSNKSVFIFPEGTRSYSTDPNLILPFKKGAFFLAVQSGVPIIPVVVQNTSKIYSPRNWIFKSGTIHIDVLEPIQTTGLTNEDVGPLTERVRDLMLKRLQKFSSDSEHTPLSLPPSAQTSTIKLDDTNHIDSSRGSSASNSKSTSTTNI